MPDLIAQGAAAATALATQAAAGSAARASAARRGLVHALGRAHLAAARRHCLSTMAGCTSRCWTAARNPVFYRGHKSDQFSLQPGEHFVIGQTTFTLVDEQVQRLARSAAAGRRADVHASKSCAASRSARPTSGSTSSAACPTSSAAPPATRSCSCGSSTCSSAASSRATAAAVVAVRQRRGFRVRGSGFRRAGVGSRESGVGQSEIRNPQIRNLKSPESCTGIAASSPARSSARASG